MAVVEHTSPARVNRHAVVNHPDIDKIGVTGSTEVGKGETNATALTGTKKKLTLSWAARATHLCQ